MQRLAVRVLRRFKGDARRAVQLAHNHALGAIDDERALGRHERQFAHEHSFLLRAFFVLEMERDVEGRAVSDAFAQAFQPILFRLADFITVVIQFGLVVVTRDRKNLFEHCLEAEELSPGGRDFGLQKLDIRIDLDFDQVRRRDDFFDFSEVNSFCCSRWHFDLWLLAGTGPVGYFCSGHTTPPSPGSPRNRRQNSNRTRFPDPFEIFFNAMFRWTKRSGRKTSPPLMQQVTSLRLSRQPPRASSWQLRRRLCWRLRAGASVRLPPGPWLRPAQDPLSLRGPL